uniref:Uncharacterized protein n=1 Tax=Ciona intestinalis TaxID=7719 RepID=H2XZS9_CIOIN
MNEDLHLNHRGGFKITYNIRISDPNIFLTSVSSIQPIHRLYSSNKVTHHRREIDSRRRSLY